MKHKRAKQSPPQTGINGDVRRRVWLAVRACVYIAVIVIFFSSEELYMTGTEGDLHPAAERIIITFAIAAAGVLLPFFVQWKAWPKRFGKKAVTAVYMVMIPAVLFLTLCMCEHIHGFNFLEIRKRFILFNGVLVFCIYLVFHIITNRVKWSLMLTYVLIIAASSVNYYVNIFRGEAVSAADIFVVGTALNVAGNYEFAFTQAIFRCILVGALLLTGFTWMPKETMYLRRWFRVIYDALALVFVVFTVWLFAVSDWPNTQEVKVRVFNPMKTYKKNGELLNFVRGFYFMLMDVPDGYSANRCLQLMDQLDLESDAADYDDGRENPNVIFIMNESLGDFSKFEDMELSEDPLPYIHSLQGQSNVITGNLHVDVFGGRTANTEYEVQTGNSLYYMPADATPYAMYVRKPEPSLTWNMTDIGYCGNEAFHPYHGNGYSRPRAYPNLGFQRFVAIEDIEDELGPEDYLRKWVSDETDFRYVTKLYEEARETSDAPYYLYNVTMQNHGGYADDYENFEQDIEIGGEKYTELEAIEDTKRYVNLTQYSDEAFEKLTAYFSEVDEPTILVMYGDHLPTFENRFYKTLWKDEDAGKKAMEKYTTPLVIWANYDINEGGAYDEVFRDVSVNYLGAEIMKLAGLPMTAYQKFLVEMQKEVPVLTVHGILDREGNYYPSGEEGYPFDDLLEQYSYLVYNSQFDMSHRNDAFFTLQTEHSALEVYKEQGGF